MNEIVIAYGMGNLHSVRKKLQKIGVNAELSCKPEKILCATEILLPGVGQFSTTMKNLKTLHLYDALIEAVIVKKTHS